jgi:hypothetical protein
MFEAYDRAGNKRTFAGQSFQLSPYRLEESGRPTVLIPGTDLGGHGTAGSIPNAAASPLIQETASWLNLTTPLDTSLRIEVTARSYGEAAALGQKVVDALRPLLAGDPARVSVVTNVQPEAPEAGVVLIEAIENSESS